MTHAGAGSIITALECGAIVVVVPRLKKFGEAYDDHQLELSEVLSRKGYVKVVYDVKKLESALEEIHKIKSPNVNSNKKLINFLRKYLESVKNEERRLS